MSWWIRIIFVSQILAAGYGAYAEFMPRSLQFRPLPAGMGLGVTLIAATMAVTLAVVQRERRDQRAERTKRSSWDVLSERLSASAPFHEREFYSLWAEQMTNAQNNVDVTHLGPRPPQNQHGRVERKYFQDLRRLCKESRAQIRRVERLTPEKVPWIRQLVSELSGLNNFSLRVYRDPSPDEMPFALSVCRVDDRYAWLVAIAEHQSTSSFRDLLVTGHDSVDLIRRYFQERLWNRSAEIIDRGQLKPDWEKELGT
jgi:hypothetical protein